MTKQNQKIGLLAATSLVVGNIIGAGIFVGSVFGTIIGAPVGFIYGFESLGESKLYNSNDYKIKFDDNIKSNINNQE